MLSACDAERGKKSGQKRGRMKRRYFKVSDFMLSLLMFQMSKDAKSHSLKMRVIL